MSSPTTGAHTRRAADEAQYHRHSRAAEAMRADATQWRDVALNLTASPDVYGPDHADYLAGTIARLEVVAAWCDHLADKNQGYADTYWALMHKGSV